MSFSMVRRYKNNSADGYCYLRFYYSRFCYSNWISVEPNPPNLYSKPGLAVLGFAIHTIKSTFLLFLSLFKTYVSLKNQLLVKINCNMGRLKKCQKVSCNIWMGLETTYTSHRIFQRQKDVLLVFNKFFPFFVFFLSFFSIHFKAFLTRTCLGGKSKMVALSLSILKFVFFFCKRLSLKWSEFLHIESFLNIFWYK